QLTWAACVAASWQNHRREYARPVLPPTAKSTRHGRRKAHGPRRRRSPGGLDADPRFQSAFVKASDLAWGCAHPGSRASRRGHLRYRSIAQSECAMTGIAVHRHIHQFPTARLQGVAMTLMNEIIESLRRYQNTHTAHSIARSTIRQGSKSFCQMSCPLVKPCPTAKRREAEEL